MVAFFLQYDVQRELGVSRIIRRELPATFLPEDDQVNQERCVTRILILHRLHSDL